MSLSALLASPALSSAVLSLLIQRGQVSSPHVLLALADVTAADAGGEAPAPKRRKGEGDCDESGPDAEPDAFAAAATAASSSSASLSSSSSSSAATPAAQSSSSSSSSQASSSSSSSNSKASTTTTTKKEKKEKKPPRPFDMSQCRLRPIALRLSYDGEPYSGYSQNVGDPIDESVEGALFAALVKVRLVSGRDAAKYSRCGRTDKGVSAFGQVISLSVRSAFNSDVPDGDLPPNSVDEVTSRHADADAGANADDADASSGAKSSAVVRPVVSPKKSATRELDYCKMLNGVLPPEIRALSWVGVTSDFSARFSCTSRTYRYFFVRRELDLGRMCDALGRIRGEHDFRNLCKMDAEHVANFKRTIFDAKIVCNGKDFDPAAAGSSSSSSSSSSGADPRASCYFEIRGQAFLWHMVRNIASVMFLVGRGLEEPSVVDFLFDVGSNPRKPHYDMADDLPLVLHRCDYGRLSLCSNAGTLFDLQRQMEGRWERHAIKAAQLLDAVEALSAECRVRRGEVTELADGPLRKFQTTASADESAGGEEEGGDEERSRGNESNGGIGNDDDDDDDFISWGEACDWLKDRRGLLPFKARECPHVPLTLRKTGLTYEEKVGNMKGKTKERFDECQRKQKLPQNDAAFYRKKQSQGDLLEVASDL